MGTGIGVAIPFWLDRPDEEAVEIAIAADRVGLETVWVGEMHSFDAFALATAIGLRTDRIALKIGPLPIGVRGPVSIALGVASVATLTGRPVDIALGASSPMIVSGWHDRPWSGAAGRMRETAIVLRSLLDGERADFDGEHVRTHGFRLRRAQPQASLTIAAFGPALTRVAARHADEVVLNLVDSEHVADGPRHARRAGRCSRPPGPAAGGVGTRGSRSRPSSAGAALGTAGRLPRRARVRRAVHEARVRLARGSRPRR